MQKPQALLFIGALAMCACALLPGPKSPDEQRFACQVEVLEPVVGSVLDAEELMRDVYAGKASLDAVAAYFKLELPEILRINAALHKCDAGDEPELKGVSARLVAPPPAYGNKIL